MKASAALLAVAVLAVACSSDDPDNAVVVGSGPERVAAVDADSEPSPADGLAHCDDVPRLRSRLEGKLSGRRNPDHIVEGVLLTYAMEHPDTFGGRWIDRDSGGVLVMGFTDDPEPHRAAILARRPSPDDYPAVDPPPPITDDRPLGERDDVVIDVLQVRFSEIEADAIHDELFEVVSLQEWQGFGLDGSAYDIHLQRVTLYLVNPPEGALAEIAVRVPDPSALCVEVTSTPQPPGGPLDVIPDLDVEDPLVSCSGTPVVRYSQLIDPPPIDEIDHPAVDVLRAELASPDAPLPRPQGPWVVISIDDDRATFAVLLEGGFGTAVVERRGDRWVFSGEAYGRPCEPVVPLPSGLARVEVHLDIDPMPDAGDTTINLLVTEQGCANGREMGDALRGPQVIETDDAVVLAFAVVPIAGTATCPGNPSAAVTVELSEPLGRRWVYDGLHFPPKPLFAVADPATSTEFRDTFQCLSGSAFAARIRPDAEVSAFETANEALLDHLGDLSEPLYDIEVAERGFGYEQWRVAVEDSNGEAHFGTVRAVSTAEGLWRIEQARWCLTTVGNRDTVWRGAALKHGRVAAARRLLRLPDDVGHRLRGS